MKRREFVKTTGAALGLASASAAANQPKNPLDYRTFAALERLDTPTASNVIETFKVRPRDKGFMRPEIRSIFPDLGSMLGYAVVGKIRAAQPPPEEANYAALSDWWDYVVSVPAPRVVVIEDLDEPPAVGSFWGEVNGSIHQALGCAGVVTNGGVRDLKEVREMGFHYYAPHVVVSHAFVHMVEFGSSVSVGGMAIRSGDLIHADLHGVHTIPLEVAPRIPGVARKIFEREHQIIDFCHSAEFSLEKLKELVSG